MSEQQDTTTISEEEVIEVGESEESADVGGSDPE